MSRLGAGWLGVVAALAATILGMTVLVPRAGAAELAELPVLSSRDGVLDLLMVARAAPIGGFGALKPTGWVYDVCLRPADGAMACPKGRNEGGLYGGTRLQLQPGDTLKVRLVNRLPKVLDSAWATLPHRWYLTLNPVNLHTHGMLVAPRMPSVDDPTYGDSVFIMTFNPQNGPPRGDSMIHGDMRFDFTDYRIKVPASHPPGLYWFHPHTHGISVNQISAGMSGMITVGEVGDYIGGAASRLPVRHIMLKDTQVLADSTLVDEQLPLFCPEAPAPGEAWQGGCPGDRAHRGGRWFFTLNGQPYPTATIPAGGEIWRIVQSSASVAYDLDFHVPAEKRDLVVQLLAVDGVAVGLPADYHGAGLAAVGGAKFEPTPCPAGTRANDGVQPICIGRLLMLPSSRAEVWVAYRDAKGRLASAPPGTEVVFRTIGRQTGPAGDSWPPVDLARLVFRPQVTRSGQAQTLAVRPDARALANPLAISRDLKAYNEAAPSETGCRPLAAGHRRRIFFNLIPAPRGEEQPFGLGYEEVDQNGRPVPGTFHDIEGFNPDVPTICLPLGPGGSPVHETWELVNIAGEDHNFHIHQVKFAVATRDEISGAILPTDGVLHDNLPLVHADGDCKTIARWRRGRCLAHPVLIDVPFTIAGDFVYHCHILEHEDGGMMAVIRVRRGS
jgi:FtsP/CotA-like multicopper oxidase with cupredoxin domain